MQLIFVFNWLLRNSAWSCFSTMQFFIYLPPQHSRMRDDSSFRRHTFLFFKAEIIQWKRRSVTFRPHSCVIPSLTLAYSSQLSVWMANDTTFADGGCRCWTAVDFAVGTNDGFTHSLFAEEAGGSSVTPFGKASLFLPRHKVVTRLNRRKIGLIRLALIIGESWEGWNDE